MFHAKRANKASTTTSTTTSAADGYNVGGAFLWAMGKASSDGDSDSDGGTTATATATRGDARWVW